MWLHGSETQYLTMLNWHFGKLLLKSFNEFPNLLLTSKYLLCAKCYALVCLGTRHKGTTNYGFLLNYYIIATHPSMTPTSFV